MHLGVLAADPTMAMGFTPAPMVDLAAALRLHSRRNSGKVKSAVRLERWRRLG